MNRRLTGILCVVLLAKSGSVLGSGKKNGEDGLPLTLPRTLLNVDLTVSKTVKYSGEFCRFADLFERELISGDFVMKCQDMPTSETSVDAFSVTPVGVPDPRLSYVIPPNRHGGWGIDASSALDFTEHGLLNSIDVERTSRRLEIVTGILGSTLGLIGKLHTFGVPAGAPPPPPPPPPPPNKVLDDAAFRKEVLTDWRLIWNYERLDGGRKEVFVNLWKAKDPGFSAARNAYAEIADMKKRYQALLEGQGATGSSTLLPQVQSELDKALKRYFLGFSKSATWSPTFEVEPDESSAPLIAIGDCGAALRLGAKARLSKNPITPEVECGKAATAIDLEVVKSAAVSLPKLPDRCLEKDSRTLTGIPFIVPQDATVGLSNVPEAPQQQVRISQGGTISCLSLPGGSYTAAVTYWASTGAVKSVKFTTKSSLSKDSVSSLGGIASDFQKAVADAKQKAADEAADKDLNALKGQRERLEERVKIQAACSTLNMSCDF